MDSGLTSPGLVLVTRLLYVGSAVAYLTHLWLVWRRVRFARAAMFGLPPARRSRVTVQAEILVHQGQGFLFRDVMPAPDE